MKRSFTLFIAFILIFFAIGCKADDECRRCTKKADYYISGDGYCEEHYLDVLGEVIAWEED